MIIFFLAISSLFASSEFSSFFMQSDSESAFTSGDFSCENNKISLQLCLPGYSKDLINVFYTDDSQLVVEVEPKEKDKKSGCSKEKADKKPVTVFKRHISRLTPKTIKKASAKAKDGVLHISIELKDVERHKIQVES